MADALRRGFKVLKPWGDSSPFDVAIPFGNRIVRVQVKSTSCRTGTGYFCQFKPNYLSDPYTLDQLDLFAAYVIMQDTWYLIPARVLLGGAALKQGLMLYPMQPLKKSNLWMGCSRGRQMERKKRRRRRRPSPIIRRINPTTGTSISTTAKTWVLQ